ATLLTWPEVASALTGAVREVMLGEIGSDLAARLQGKASLVVGPGLGTDARARQAITDALGATTQPAVLDADGLGHFEGRAAALARWGHRLVLTPHAGELARL